MPSYIVEIPGRGKFKVQSDSPITSEQAYSLARSQLGPDDFDKRVKESGGLSGSAMTDMVAGYGSAIPRMLRGAGQRLGLVSQEDADVRNKEDEPLMKSGAGMAGNILGNIAPAVAAAFIPGANTVAGAGAIGAMQGAAVPTSTGESVGGNVALGGLGGAGGQVAGRMLPQMVGSLAAPFTNKGRQSITSNTLRNFANGPLNISPANTPGWQPTLAEATQDPGMALLQRGAQARSPDVARALAERQMEQNSAVVGAVRGMAGSPADRALEERLRGYVTKPLYDQAAKQGIDPGMAAALKPQIDDLMNRPSMKQAASRAKDIFGEESVTLAKNGSVKGLQYMKQTLDDMIEKAGSPMSSIGKNELRALEQTRSDLLSVIQDVAPIQRQADHAYRIFSQDLNQMNVARALDEKLTPALMDGMDVPGRLRAESFANALRNLDEQVPKMTGFPGATVENVMSKDAMKTLTGARDDLARRAMSQEMGRGPGSNTAQNLAIGNVLERTLGPLGLPQSWVQGIASSTLGKTAASPLGLIYNRGAEQRAQEELARALLDPAYAQGLLSMSPGVNPLVANAYRGLLGASAPAALAYGSQQ